MDRRRFLGAAAATAAAGLLASRYVPAGAGRPAKFAISYTGNPPADVQAAVQYGVDQWAKLLSSPVDIRLAIDWSPGGLPSSVSISSASNFANAPLRDVVYPTALASRFAGVSVAGTSPDIRLFFNSTASPTGVADVFSWYLGTDGKPSPVQYDLVTHTLVQLARGLGLLPTVRVSGPSGTFGTSNKPVIADTFLTDGAGKPITSFSPNSVELGSALYAGYYFSGPKTNALLGAPAKFSIVSNALDIGAFPICSTDSLLVSFITLAGMSRLKPNALDRAILDDLGWQDTANQAAAGDHGAGVQLLTISASAPFARGCDCSAAGLLVPLQIGPLDQQANQSPTTITVNFSADFPEAARVAVRKAAANWAAVLTTPVEIIVSAQWNLSPNGSALGRCTPTEVVNFPGAPFKDVRYQTALANRIADQRVASGHDMLIQFASGDATFWSFDAEGAPGPYQYDLVSVAMHEIAHGLGHIGTPLALTPGDQPRVWDLFFGGRADQRLLDYAASSPPLSLETGAFANFRGPRALQASQGAQVRLHASGHRLSTAFCAAEPAVLMAPSSFPGQVTRPDETMLASLWDIGWGGTPSLPAFRRVVGTSLARD